MYMYTMAWGPKTPLRSSTYENTRPIMFGETPQFIGTRKKCVFWGIFCVIIRWQFKDNCGPLMSILYRYNWILCSSLYYVDGVVARVR